MALGKHQKEMLEFVSRLKPGEMHSMTSDQTTQRAAIGLARRGLINILRYRDVTEGPFRFIQRLEAPSCGGQQ